MAENDRNIHFVFPVFNESLNIPRVLADLSTLESMVAGKASGTRFIFVDDGSTDGTSGLLEAVGRGNLRVLKHENNRGPGAAFQTAFSYLAENGLKDEDLVITLEGDATSDPAIFSRMLKRTEEGDDLIMASPYLYGGGFSKVTGWRVLLSHLANFLFKLLLNIRGLATFSCFFRIYRGHALLTLHRAYQGQIVGCSGFDCAAEILVKAVRNGLSISEVPFKVDWARRKGKSKMKILKTSFAYFALFWKFWWKA